MYYFTGDLTELGIFCMVVVAHTYDHITWELKRGIKRREANLSCKAKDKGRKKKEYFDYPPIFNLKGLK
jgi:hypothetical protein